MKYTHYRIFTDSYRGYEVRLGRKNLFGRIIYKEVHTNTHRTLKEARKYALSRLNGYVEEGTREDLENLIRLKK